MLLNLILILIVSSLIPGASGQLSVSQSDARRMARNSSARGNFTLHANPESIDGLASSRPTLVLITGVHGAPRAVVADLRYLEITSPVFSGDAFAFIVRRVAYGETTVTVKDESGDFVVIPVRSEGCLPHQSSQPPTFSFPVKPKIGLALLRPNQAYVPTTIYFYSAFAYSEGSASDGTTYRLRLLASDGTVFAGGPITIAPNRAPAEPALQAGTLYQSEVDTIPVGLTFEVQLVRRPCEASLIVGKFST